MVDDPVIVRGLSVEGGSNAPTILQRTDQEFIPAILGELSLADELRTDAGLRKAANSIAQDRDKVGVLKLYQPVHRTFHVALLEVACDTLGRPRLDPLKIESAGLVVRRLAATAGESLSDWTPHEAWTRSGKRVRGWSELNPVTKEEEIDPDPLRRPPELRSGNGEMNRRLEIWKQSPAPLSEVFTPLFVAPPEVCQTARRTLLYGVVPVTSFEVSEPPPPEKPGEESAGLPRFESEELEEKMRQHLPLYLQERKPDVIPIVPREGEDLTFADADAPELQPFILSLRQLKFEFGAFGESVTGQVLYQELNLLKTDPDDRPLGDFLKDAAEVLVDLEGRAGTPARTLRMPQDWPVVDLAQERRILTRVMAVLRGQLESLTQSEGRFEYPASRYRVRAFVRVKRSDGCPPGIFWSDYSEPFRIVPWYENNGMPPVKITLPDPFDQGFLGGLKPNGILKPNVAFVVPERLFNLLNKNSPDDFLKGKAAEGGFQLGLDWICGFNIPIITLCAFIVLFIFLSLLNLIFWWLPFIKICIPFPKKQ
jgi:hypothetical protein